MSEVFLSQIVIALTRGKNKKSSVVITKRYN